MLRLTDMRGSDVRALDGTVVGQLVDLTAEIGESHPPVNRLAVGRGRHIAGFLPWDAVVTFERGDVGVSSAAVTPAPESGLLEPREVFLRRDVLDTQIVDIAGKRLARVADVLLLRDGDVVRVMAVEVGAAGVWRRLGFDRLAQRAPQTEVDWSDLHLTSERGHALQLATSESGVHRLGSTELAGLLARLPTAKAAQVLGVVTADSAAQALSASHPRVGARLLPELSSEKTASVVERMPSDDVTAMLRRVTPDELETVLSEVGSDRAGTLRRLLAHAVDTAGGLMNTEVLTATVGETPASIAARVAAHPPLLAGMSVVFVVDEDGRPIGSYEPIDLLAGRASPRPVPKVTVTTPVERVIDLFALHDHLALPVVDTAGRLVGAVAVDDVLEELLAERLPGRGRFTRIRRALRR